MAGVRIYTAAGIPKDGITDHGELSGLADDDHSQYLLVDGTRAMTGALDMDDHDIADVDQVGIGTGSPDASAALHVVDTGRGSVAVPVMTAAQLAAISSPIEGLMGYESDTDMMRVYDAQRYRNVEDIGWLPYAYVHGMGPAVTVTNTLSIAANGGSLAVPILLAGHMLLESVSIHQTATSTQRTWAWDLYVQYLNNGNSGENTLTRVAASNGSDTFTPGAASDRTLGASSPPIYLGPGLYWLVIQNRHATNTFVMGVANATFVVNTGQTKTTTNPNGATLDFVAATWTKTTSCVGARLDGRVFGQTAAF